MDVNADSSSRVLLHGDAIPWEPSPVPGVDRRRLDRVCGEHERVTTIVRYAPGSRFSPHVHPGGEEFIVLDGVFQDEYGDWPAGSYVRNPPTSKHTPGSVPGCVIFVKLWQFAPSDRTFVHTRLDRLEPVPHRDRAGVAVASLYRDERESVRLEVWDANAAIECAAPGGAELFVLNGGFLEGGAALRAHSWLRVPPGGKLHAKTGPTGARVWIKSGHLGAYVSS